MIRLPARIEGKPVKREEPCRVCGATSAEQIGTVDYWDIKTSRLVKCPLCRHIQLDPMLTDDETSRGCFAYYIEELLRTGHEEMAKNCVRNFRRGVLFGFSLKKKNILPGQVLELGPGSGYFSAGLQFVFPQCLVTVMDVNPEVLRSNREHHQYKTIQGLPDNFIEEYQGKFDLVIARDIIEHVTNISTVLTNINLYLKPGGHLHFITPNGHEDVWKHYLTAILKGQPSLLLINHVNYYDGKGLRDLLYMKGFTPVDYYTYTIKTTLRGSGWKKSSKLMNPVSGNGGMNLNISDPNSTGLKQQAGTFLNSAGEYINNKTREFSNIGFSKEEILNHWYISHKATWITYLYSRFQHGVIIRLRPELNVGHEIYGLFKTVVH